MTTTERKLIDRKRAINARFVTALNELEWVNTALNCLMIDGYGVMPTAQANALNSKIEKLNELLDELAVMDF